MLKKIHRLSGLIFGVWLFILGVTGLLLNHDKNDFSLDFLWNIEIPDFFLSEDALKKHKNREITSYLKCKNKEFIASQRGLFVKVENYWIKVFNGRVFKAVSAINEDFSQCFSKVILATDTGVYTFENGKINLLGLKNKVITSVAVYNDTIFAVEKKRKIFKKDGNSFVPVQLPEDAETPQYVKFGRFVRDFHYGRGLLLNPASMWINDFASAVWVFLTVSGGLLFLIRKRIISIKYKTIKSFHSNIWVLLTAPLIFLLALTGLFIDHPKLFSFITSADVKTSYLPPVYKEAYKEIWDIDFDGKTLRIGTRYGVYALKNGYLKLESKGFAYKFIRIGDRLFVSGMGSPNRVFDGKNWNNFKSKVHMPVAFIKEGNKVKAVSKNDIKFNVSAVPLYTFLLSFHDGSIFDKNFILLNDFSAVAVFVLLITGLIFYLKRVKLTK